MSSWFESWTGYQLLAPAWLLVGVAAAVIALFVRSRRGGPALWFGPAPLLGQGLDRVPLSWRTALIPLPRALEVLGVLLVSVALARPVEAVAEPAEDHGIDIVLCLDVSSSMNAADMDESRTRMEVVQDAAQQFVDARPSDRIGLICFARYADARCPPTRDHDALTAFIADVVTVPSDGPEDATGIGTAVARAAQVLAGSTSPSRVVVLLTDGEENVATADAPDEIAPVHAAQLCEQLGVRVYTIAAGVGQRVPGGGFVAVDTRDVRLLSQRTRGAFFAARDAAAVENVFGAIDALEKAAQQQPEVRLEERFGAFAMAALVFLLVGRVIGLTVFEVAP